MGAAGRSTSPITPERCPARAALIIGLSCAVLVVLFLLQQFGTGAIGFLFSPIIITWLGFILGAAASRACMCLLIIS